MNKINFDYLIDRSNNYSAKWNLADTHLDQKIIPMSVADMDLPAPQEVVDILEQSNNGIYGYTVIPDTYYTVVKNYIFRHYDYDVDIEDIVFCPRIIQAISIYIREFTKEGDSIGIFTPSYHPILNIISLNNRYVNRCQLDYSGDNYVINFNKLEECFKTSKVFLLISPHNPTGKVWTQDELYKIAKLAEKYQVFLISDDVHSDFEFSSKHIFISSLNSYVKEHSLICTSPAKTFNIPGLEVANIILHNNEIKEKFKSIMLALGMHNPNYFSIPAIMTAYTDCDYWLCELKKYIQENKSITRNFLKKEIPELVVTDSDGTYLMWINYEKLNIDEEKLQYWFLKLSGIEICLGSEFGYEGQNFFRINVAMPRFLLKDCLMKIKESFVLLQKRGFNYEQSN
ncbi:MULTISPECIES: MalY/PatB family protein [Pasteurellaceae]|uniref:cysteine-S-conjugate beta-lyase n=1 Tax=Pasteurella atlantica TaxID=2827233 RepID=A0AAW8CG92_9PAST|nr:MalY/PatB family protein [Pasteurella atlantica]MBR0573148.1 pyridoxal phosphate-dependent aminotransferase [Pasteurella atlantica]MDP8038995.1 MalY/PatB family protein [Pasteurella atlantica]MDP8041085.1 MalY/PatB family protein [Pasteurella atlantica]MDP8043302.1 MalY/PatB family protein [Pasteurella atlantica]MDP8045388.1 MalY/PatB family protein [Pasteurella atlantica]